MTKNEYYKMLDIIDSQIEEEKALCDHYTKLNPDDSSFRQALRDSAINALIVVRVAMVDRFRESKI